MVISHYGFTCFKIGTGDRVIAIDPFTKGGTLPAPRFEANVILFTDPNADHRVSIAGDPLVFATPGEFETSNISYVGFAAGETAPFFIEAEGMKLLHLGKLKNSSDLEPILDHIDVIDILFISGTIPATEAQKMISQIDPRIVVPMQGDPDKKYQPESFIKELGGKAEKLDKLTIKKKGLPADEQKFFILSAERS